jgi:hypothetical protein
MSLKKVLKIRISFIMFLLVYLLAIPAGSNNLTFIENSSATSDYANWQLGSLSQIYESNNNPGAISSGYGDWGGVSYGAYQFASNLNVPYLFVQWMDDEHSSYYDRLETAYTNDGYKYGSNFNTEWQAIAKEDSATFLKLQHKYIKNNYYDKTIRKLERDIGFDVNNYSIALKNTIWSRSVQHGWSGGANVIINAFSSIDIEQVSEEVLIKAIYLESGMKVDQPPHSNSIKMGDGRYMKYFSRNSAAVQQSVWKRLNVNELKDALKMLEDKTAIEPVQTFATMPISKVEIGDRVIDNSWQWEFRTGDDYTYQPGDVTKPVVWIVVAKDHYGPGSGVTLLSEETIGSFVFDNSTDRGHVYDWHGYNHWGDSGKANADRGLRPWLNSTGIHREEGLYKLFSEAFKKAVLTTSIPNKKWKYGDVYNTRDNVFIPSITELGGALNSDYQIGTAYPYFANINSSDYFVEYNENIAFSNQWYWTRTVSQYDGHIVRLGSFGNHLFGEWPFYWDANISAGVRPL